jgi:hypothetical protein
MATPHPLRIPDMYYSAVIIMTVISNHILNSSGKHTSDTLLMVSRASLVVTLSCCEHEYIATDRSGCYYGL